MTCPACKAAHSEPRADFFTNDCESCKARALAATGAHLESSELGHMTPDYRIVLGKMFHEDWQRGHALVKEWGDRIKGQSKVKA